MTQTSPPSGFHRGWLVAFCVFGGMLLGYAFHELAGFRPFVPPILSGGNNMACADLDAYVQHVSDMPDHHIHAVTFGIHRRDTIEAVNELYDRARCNPHQDTAGHETYKQFHATVVDDVNDPGPHAALEQPRSYPLYSHGVLVAPATTSVAAAPVIAEQARPIRRRRRAVTIVDDLNQAGTPAGAASVGTLGPPPLAYTTADTLGGPAEPLATRQR